MPRIWKFGRDVDTDQIVPGRYAPYMRPDADVGTAAFIEAHPEFNEHAQPGDILVADENFGCGSSREYAPQALKNREIAAIIAKSFARIFYRNAINLGLPVFVAPEVVDQVSDGQNAVVDIAGASLEVDNKQLQLPTIPDFALQIVDAGGIASYVKEHGRFPDVVG